MTPTRNVDISVSLTRYASSAATAATTHARVVAAADATLAAAPRTALQALDADLGFAATDILKKFGKVYTPDHTLATDVATALAALVTAAAADPLNFDALAQAVKIAHASTQAALAA